MSVRDELIQIADHMDETGKATGEYFWCDECWLDEDGNVDMEAVCEVHADRPFRPCCLIGAFYAVRNGEDNDDETEVRTWFQDLITDLDETALALVDITPELDGFYGGRSEASRAHERVVTFSDAIREIKELPQGDPHRRVQMSGWWQVSDQRFDTLKQARDWRVSDGHPDMKIVFMHATWKP